MQFSHHIKDLITAYGAMPENPKRKEVLACLKSAYVSATSDELADELNTKLNTDSGSPKSSIAGLIRGSDDSITINRIGE